MAKFIEVAAVTLGLLGIASCANTELHSALALEWEVTGLAQPESVTFSRDGTVLYVSNIDGDASDRDGRGFISRVSLTGEVLEREWITGLDAPKGVMSRGNLLYVSDVRGLVIFNALNGQVFRRADVQDAGFLNDLAFAADGRVLISDSANSRIYVFEGETASVWLQDERLSGVNGMLQEPGRLLAVTTRGLLLAIDNETQEISVLSEGLGAADGIAHSVDGGYLVSDAQGRLFAVAADGAHEVWIDSRHEGRRLNDFVVRGDMLYVPNMVPGALSAFRIPPTS